MLVTMGYLDGTEGVDAPPMPRRGESLSAYTSRVRSYYAAHPATPPGVAGVDYPPIPPATGARGSAALLFPSQIKAFYDAHPYRAPATAASSLSTSILAGRSVASGAKPAAAIPWTTPVVTEAGGTPIASAPRPSVIQSLINAGSANAAAAAAAPAAAPPSALQPGLVTGGGGGGGGGGFPVSADPSFVSEPAAATQALVAQQQAAERRTRWIVGGGIVAALGLGYLLWGRRPATP